MVRIGALLGGGGGRETNQRRGRCGWMWRLRGRNRILGGLLLRGRYYRGKRRGGWSFCLCICMYVCK